MSNISFSMHSFLITLTTMRDSNISKLLAQIGTPAEEDLLSWAHHSDSSTIPDGILQAASANQVPSQTMLPHPCLVFFFLKLLNFYLIVMCRFPSPSLARLMGNSRPSTHFHEHRHSTLLLRLPSRSLHLLSPESCVLPRLL